MYKKFKLIKRAVVDFDDFNPVIKFYDRNGRMLQLDFSDKNDVVLWGNARSKKFSGMRDVLGALGFSIEGKYKNVNLSRGATYVYKNLTFSVMRNAEPGERKYVIIKEVDGEKGFSILDDKFLDYASALRYLQNIKKAADG